MAHNLNNPLHCLYFHINLNQTLLNNAIILEITEDSPLYHLLISIRKIISSTPENQVIRHILNAIMLLISQQRQLITVSDQRLETIMKCIHKSFGSDLSNTKLAGLINLDSRYFIRLFKKNYGQTPHEYLSSYRAFQAANLLACGMPVKEVAKLAGFEDIKAFSRFFKTQKGISPSHYKSGTYGQP